MRRPATFEDLLARADLDRLEIIGGEIVKKAYLPQWPRPKAVDRARRDGSSMISRWDETSAEGLCRALADEAAALLADADCPRS